MTDSSAEVKAVFKEKFEEEPHCYYSPGRINLIGEHVDYNDGFVMPAAIDKGIFFAIALNDSEQINCYSLDFDESLSLVVSEVKKMEGWKNYVLGIVREFQNLKLPVRGFNCVFGGNIPIGSGMSSSAALEGGISYSLNELGEFKMSRKELALLGQRAEHNFPGVKCGIMDQYANMMGKEDTVLLLDCKHLTHEALPLDLQGYRILLINTKVHHSLAGSAYNQRRMECEKGLMILRKDPRIQSFRDVEDPERLLEFKDEMGDATYRRCLFVVEEILRTRRAAAFLKENNVAGLGALMFQTHEGLKELYEVSCKELDFLVSAAKENTDVIGARLMGGGFGGCTINIVKQEGVESFLVKILSAYKKEFCINAESYQVEIVEGTHAV